MLSLAGKESFTNSQASKFLSIGSLAHNVSHHPLVWLLCEAKELVSRINSADQAKESKKMQNLKEKHDKRQKFYCCVKQYRTFVLSGL